MSGNAKLGQYTASLGVAIALGIAVGFGQTLWTLSGMAAVVLLLGALRRPDWATVLLLAWLPIEIGLTALTHLPGQIAVAGDLISLAVLIAYVSKRFLVRSADDWSRVPRPVVLALIGFVASALLSVLVNRSDAFAGLLWLRGFIRFVPLALVVSDRAWRKTVREAILPVAFFLGAVETALAIAQAVTGGRLTALMIPQTTVIGSLGLTRAGIADMGNRLIVGTAGHYNILGLFGVLLVGVYLAHLLGERPVSLRQAAWLYTFATVVSGVVIATQSRQSILCLAAVWLFFLGLRSTRTDRNAATVILTAVMVALIVVVSWSWVSSLQPAQRIADLQDVGFWQGSVAKNRGYVSSAVLVAILRGSPIVGIGPGMLSAAVTLQGVYGAASRLGLDPTFSSYVADVGWVNIIAHVGLLGLISLSWLCWWLLKGALDPKRAASSRLLAASVFAVFAIGSLASTPIAYKPTGVWLMVLGALVLFEPNVPSEDESLEAPSEIVIAEQQEDVTWKA